MSTKITARHSVSEHIARIETALSHAKEAFFEVFLTIKQARDDLGDDTFQKVIAHQLSISEATVSRYLQIADCAPLFKRQELLPPTVNTLYELAQIRSALLTAHGHEKGEAEFKKVLDDVDNRTEASQLVDVLKQARQQAATASKKQKEEKVLALSDSKVTAREGEMELNRLPRCRRCFRPRMSTGRSSSTTRRCVADGLEAGSCDDIAGKFHIADLSAVSGETVQGFVYCAADHIEAGLKLLTAAGFNFRDLFIPSIGAKGLNFSRPEVLLGREGTRPPVRRPPAKWRAREAGAVSIAKDTRPEPRLYVFAPQPIEGWTCAAPGQS